MGKPQKPRRRLGRSGGALLVRPEWAGARRSLARATLSGERHRARALATLGVDRGIDRFERVAILRRNGLSFLATAQGSLFVRAVPGVELLQELDAFIGSALRLDNPGHAISAALRALQTAMFDACRGDRLLTEVLAAAGALERAVARSTKARDRVRPLRRLSAEWLAASADGSTELAIAAAVASWRIRPAIEPVDENDRWDDAARRVWTDRAPLENIVALARRRLMPLDKEAAVVPLAGGSSITQGHLRRLLRGAIDPRRLTDLVFGLSLVADGVLPRASEEAEPYDDAVFAVLRAVTSPWFLAQQDGRHPSPRTITAILARLAAHDVNGALEIAEHRLKASGRPPKVTIRQRDRHRSVQALAAALVIPLPRRLESD